jgi:hypothetical protein
VLLHPKNDQIQSPIESVKKIRLAVAEKSFMFESATNFGSPPSAAPPTGSSDLLIYPLLMIRNVFERKARGLDAIFGVGPPRGTR